MTDPKQEETKNRESGQDRKDYPKPDEAGITIADRIRKLQYQIDYGQNSQKQMLEIGRSYLEGSILRDDTAAEAWLMRVIDAGETPEAVQAMELLGCRIHGRKLLLTDEDYCRVREELSRAEGKEKAYLDALERLGTAQQRSCYNGTGRQAQDNICDKKSK